MPKIHFIEGPVGAGKSTYARAIAEKGDFAHIAIDEWFVQLFSPDRPRENVVPWYTERKARLLSLILNHAYAILATNNDVVLELGMILRAPRQALFREIQQNGIDFTVHVLDAPLAIRRERVKRRNTEQDATFSMVVPDNIFEIASSMWEPPDQREIEEYEFFFPHFIDQRVKE